MYSHKTAFFKVLVLRSYLSVKVIYRASWKSYFKLLCHFVDFVMKLLVKICVRTFAYTVELKDTFFVAFQIATTIWWWWTISTWWKICFWRRGFSWWYHGGEWQWRCWYDKREKKKYGCFREYLGKTHISWWCREKRKGVWICLHCYLPNYSL